MQAVTLTDQAKQYITELLAANPGKQLWVSINNKGCSGHKYEYRLTDWDSQQRFDEVIDWPDGRLVIESKSLLGLIGSCLDLKQSQFEKHLEWINPMAVNSCGCGESFQLISDLH